MVDKFLRSKNIKKLRPGKINLDGEKVYLMVIDYKTNNSKRKSRKLECHRKYADIHIVSGKELVFFAGKSDLKLVEQYDKEKDAEFYGGRNLSYLVLSSNQFVIFLPGEPHEPGCASQAAQSVRKLVFKIRID